MAVVLAILTTSTVAAPRMASASRIDDLQAKARRLATQIDANGAKADALGEKYNGVQVRLDGLRTAQRDAARQLADAQRRASELHDGVVALVQSLYMSSGNEAGAGFVAGTSLEQGRAAVYSGAKAARDQQTIDRYRAVQDDITQRQAQLASAARGAEQERARLAAARRDVDAANAQQRRLLAQVRGELGRLIQAEQVRRERAAIAAARARAAADAAREASTTTAPAPAAGSGAGTPPPSAAPPNPVGGGSPPAPNGRVAIVIAYARAQIGKPYVFNAAGPDAFDCSGLTMMAWAQVGVSMPHFSGSQFSIFPQVPLNQLQPGDLVFKGPGGVDHVALYIGGGMQIAATHTGDFVKLQPVDFAALSGATRPG